MKLPSDQNTENWLQNNILSHKEELANNDSDQKNNSQVQDLEKYRELFDQSGDAILLFSMPDGELEDINKSGCKLFNNNYETLIQQSCHNLFPEPIVEILKNHIDTYDKTNTFPHIETPLEINNKTFHVILRCSHLHFSNNTYAVLVIHDITNEYAERSLNEELREQLIRAQKMEAIGNLAGGIAHDFNNLILAMSGHADMAKLVLDSTKEANVHLDEILNAAEKAGRLTKQLLTLGRKQTTAIEVLNINHIIHDISKMLTRLLGADKHLITNFEEHLWPVEIDPGHFEQIILNLVINARDAIDKRGTITISTYNHIIDEKLVPDIFPTSGKYIHIRVSDNGCGMNETTIAKIFEPFFTTKALEKGTGLGLSTVYSLIHQNQGIIQVESEVGKGTQFDVYFKKSNQSISSIEGSIENDPINLYDEKCILVVEDEAMIRKLIYESLRAQDFKVIKAIDGFDGLTKYNENSESIDLVVTDIRMPHMNGTQLYEEIKESGFKGEFIFISGYLGSDVDKVTKLGDSVKFIQKPFRTSQLVKTVKNILNEKRP